MIQIKLLDRPAFYYHEYERKLQPKLVHNPITDKEEIMRDDFGYIVYEKPKQDWCLPYEPAYVDTDEQWLIDRLKEYAEAAGPMFDFIGQREKIYSCSIPQEQIGICTPPAERTHKNVPAYIPKNSNERIYITTDGRRLSYDDLR